MATWDKMRALSAGDWSVLASAAALLAGARVTLPWIRFAAASAPGNASPEDVARARAVARLVAIAAARLPFSTTCLHRSLVLWTLLRRRGIASSLHLGARMSSGFGAHAWVACGGLALGEDADHLATYHAFEEAVVPRARFGS